MADRAEECLAQRLFSPPRAKFSLFHEFRAISGDQTRRRNCSKATATGHRANRDNFVKSPRDAPPLRIRRQVRRHLSQAGPRTVRRAVPIGHDISTVRGCIGWPDAVAPIFNRALPADSASALNCAVLLSCFVGAVPNERSGGGLAAPRRPISRLARQDASWRSAVQSSTRKGNVRF